VLTSVGKTQLSIQYARRFGHTYSSVFWLNAKYGSTLKDGSTLKAGMVAMATQVVEDTVFANVKDADRDSPRRRVSPI